MVQCLWYRQVDTIIDVKLGENDADSYKYEPIKELLSRWETIKKDNHGKNCHYQWKKSSFFLSVYRMLGREDLVVLSKLSQVMADKREKLLSQVWGIDGNYQVITLFSPW